MKSIDLNADVGEGFSTDSELMKYISSANVACGLHAGSPIVMAETIRSSIENGVSIGAHPGYNDREEFGRRMSDMSYKDLVSLISYQIGAINGMLSGYNTSLTHVKAHGALYNAAATDPEIAKAVVATLIRINPELKLFGPINSELEKTAISEGLQFVSETFADRAYNNDGTLVSRSLPGALIHDRIECSERVLMMIEDHKIKTITGDYLEIIPDTICLHGDNRDAVNLAEAISTAIKKAGIIIQAN